MPHHIEVDGTEIAYEEAGSGPAVVFSHAGIADRRMWQDQFADLAADYRVIAYDWRGYGQSGPAHGDYAHHLVSSPGFDGGFVVTPRRSSGRW